MVKASKAKQLVELREKLGLSQQALSQLLGVSLQTVWRWEKGKFEIDDAILRLIPELHAKRPPYWCEVGKSAAANDTKELADHLSSGCKQCRDVIYFLSKQ
jgi:transcriptional regulator with XRE-family HTH domain